MIEQDSHFKTFMLRMLRGWPLGLSRHAVLIIAAFALAALVAAACGNDEEAAPAASEAPSEQPAPVAAEDETPTSEGPLRIGFLADFSGPIAEFGPPIQTGAELAIKHINAAGGVFGQDVILAATGDTMLDPVQGAEEARRLIDIEGVHVIVGPLASDVTVPVGESVTGPAGIPTISPSATAPAITLVNDNDFLFRSTTSDAAQGPVLAQLATDEGFDNVGVLFVNDPYGQGLSEAFVEAFEGTATAASYEGEQATYLAELQAAAANGARVLVAIGFPTEAMVYIREALENDLFDQFLFVDGTRSQELIDAIGAEFLNGSKGTAPTGGPGTASGQALEADYIAEYGALPAAPFVAETYDATICLALAAEAAGSTDGVAIRDALRQVCSGDGEVAVAGAEGVAAALAAVRAGNAINYEGAATSVDWDANGDVLTGFIGIWQYQDGTIVDLEEVPFDLSN